MPSESAVEIGRKLAAVPGVWRVAGLPADAVAENVLERLLATWLATGQGELLPYLRDRQELLSRPCRNRPQAGQLFLFSFLPQADPHAPLLALPPARPGESAAVLAGYFLNEDYHRTGTRIVAQMATILAAAGDDVIDAGVDSSPLLEKALAAQAGLGVCAPNTLLFDAQHGCQLHLGFLFSARRYGHVVAGAADMAAGCGQCGACVRGCPGQALAGGRLQIARCRSWLAGSKSGPLSWAEQTALGGVLAGCSHCTTACPDVRRIVPADLRLDAEALLRLPSAAWRRILAGTALAHVGVTRLKRNAAAALGVSWSSARRRQEGERLWAGCRSPVVRQTLAAWPELTALAGGEAGAWDNRSGDDDNDMAIQG